MPGFDFDESASQSRRLPVYLVLDISGSMAGAPLQAVNQGVQLIRNELLNTPTAIETVYISVITFESQARVAVPLTELTSFQPPQLNSGGGTALGGALRLLGQSLDKDIIPNSVERKGDYKPLVFLMTDGQPTDTWEHEADAIKNRTAKKVATIIALGCGSAVNTNTLKRITEVVLIMDRVTPDAIAKYFQWVSQSLVKASVSAQAAGAGQAQADFDKPPEGIRVIM